MVPSGTGQVARRYTPNRVAVATGREWRLAAGVLYGTWRLAV